MEVTGISGEQIQSATLIRDAKPTETQGAANIDTSVMVRTAGGSVRNVHAAKEIVIGQRLSLEVNGADGGTSADAFRIANSAAAASHSAKSNETAEVVSKGGQVPDQYRESQTRRDNYLTSLLANRVSEKTNMIQKLNSPPPPMKVRINENKIDIQQFAHSTGSVTLGNEKAAALGSSHGHQFDPGRIQLNSIDIKMIKNSFNTDRSRLHLSSGDPQSGVRERIHSVGSSQHDEAANDSIVALTQYAPQGKASQDAGKGFPDISSSVQHVVKGGTKGLQIDIGIKNSAKALEARPAGLVIGSQQLHANEMRYKRAQLKGVSVDMQEEKEPVVVASKKPPSNKALERRMAREMELGSSIDTAASKTARFKRPQAYQVMMSSHDSVKYDSSKMHVYSSNNEASRTKDVFQPNKDVTRFLVNPEQALKKNLKPIQTALNKDRPPLRSLFSTKNSKGGLPALDISFQKDLGRQKRLRSPQELLKLSHDVKNAMTGRGIDYVGNFRNNMQARNMTQLPAGGKFGPNQKVIEALDTTTKIDLLRKSNQLDKLTIQGACASLEQIREKIHANPSENPLLNSEREYSTEGEIVSMQSQEGFYFQPDNSKGMLRLGASKNDPEGGSASKMQKSPFMPASVDTTAPQTGAPTTIEDNITMSLTLDDSPTDHMPQTTNEDIAIDFNSADLSQSMHLKKSNRYEQHNAQPSNIKSFQSQTQFSNARLPGASQQLISPHASHYKQLRNTETVFSKPSPRSKQNQKSWVYVPQPATGADTSRVVKRRHHNLMEEQVKQLEQKVKDRKRENEKLYSKVIERREALEQQKKITERIQCHNSQQSDAMTMHMSLDQSSQFNPSISVTQHQDSFAPLPTSNHTSIEASIDHEQNQNKVLKLYKKLITSDLETSRKKTEAQLGVERQNIDYANQGVEDLQEENRVLKRNIKRAKEVLREREEVIKAKERKELEREKAAAAGHGRNSELDSNSIKDTDVHSVASFSAMGGAIGATRIDIKKVEKINQNVLQILASKTPFETVMQVIRTYKDAFKNIARCTVFILNRYLQAYVFKDMGHHKRMFKAIQMGSRHNIVYAVYHDPKEYCKPNFSSIQAAAKPVYQQRLIYIPVVYDQLLMFAVQMESDAPQPATTNAGTSVAGGQSSSPNHRRGAYAKNAARTATVSVGSNPAKSRVSEAGFSVSRRTAVIRSLWNQSDFNVCKIISTLARARMQIFTYHIQKEQKQKMKNRVIRFVGGFIEHRTFKSLIRQVKTDLPKLLGYGHAEVFMYDHPNKNLYCMSVPMEDPSIDPDQDPPGFEEEFIVDEKQVVRFPSNMGVSGYALQGDAVCFINDFMHKKATTIGPIIADTSSSRDQVLTLPQQAFIGKILAKESPFNRKIDNFLELDRIENMAICSIQDEENIGCSRPVGILQLYNRVASDILQDDLVRVHYIRKLIGAMMIKCEMWSITLELTVGMAQANENQQRMKDKMGKLTYGHVYNLSQGIQQLQKRLEEGNEENQTNNENSGDENEQQ